MKKKTKKSVLKKKSAPKKEKFVPFNRKEMIENLMIRTRFLISALLEKTTQEELAARLQVSQSYISKLLSGKQEPDTVTYLYVSALHVGREKFFEGKTK